eukprot:CAMPEP_0194376202 /NCGR_PEP_ID=MMETSP0174-20130528/24659_1 /TAXON_ID=216777 /ORGANISM="Proboscia alata, Strain PI-D3" /LENGTH=465 /DNA_ID=CAMNT_0039156775 /DNA_START=105 /DNA_END=1502 /DNA_ORIENTATION=-
MSQAPIFDSSYQEPSLPHPSHKRPYGAPSFNVTENIQQKASKNLATRGLNNLSNLSCLEKLRTKFSITSYRDYFDVNSIDIYSRIVGVLKVWYVTNCFWDSILYTPRFVLATVPSLPTDAAVAASIISDDEKKKSLSKPIKTATEDETNANEDVKDDPKPSTVAIATLGAKKAAKKYSNKASVTARKIANTARRIASAQPKVPSKCGVYGKPDLYGPFWITNTLVFCIGVSSNLLRFLWHFEDSYTHDVRLLYHAIWVLYVYTYGSPLAFYIAIRLVLPGGAGKIRYTGAGLEEEKKSDNVITDGHYERNTFNNSWAKHIVTLSLTDLISLYGYSLVPFIPATALVGMLPFDEATWTILLMASIVSGVFLTKNIVGLLVDGDGCEYDNTIVAAQVNTPAMNNSATPAVPGSANVPGTEHTIPGVEDEQSEAAARKAARAGFLLLNMVSTQGILLLVLKLGFYNAT